MIDTMTVAAFIEKHGITFTFTTGSIPGDRMDDSWLREDFHFDCLFRMGDESSRRQLASDYHMGKGHGKPVKRSDGHVIRVIPPHPDPAEVLDSLRSDAQSVDCARDFEDWASELGYDTDSRKAHASWLACMEIGRKLRFFLGADAYAELMNCEPM
jgi:hypothetical protein